MNQPQETVGDLLRELPGVRTERLGELHGDVGGPVAVVAIARALEGDVVDRELRSAAASHHDARDDSEQGGGEIGGIHEAQA